MPTCQYSIILKRCPQTTYALSASQNQLRLPVRTIGNDRADTLCLQTCSVWVYFVSNI